MAEKFKPKKKVETEANPLIGIFTQPKGATVEEAMALVEREPSLEKPDGPSDEEVKAEIEKFLASGAAEAGYKVMIGKGEATGRYRLLANPEKEGGMKTAEKEKKNGKKVPAKAAAPSKKSADGAGESKAPKVSTKIRSAGLVETVIAHLKTPITKEQLVKKLLKDYPERTEESLKTTVSGLLGFYLKKRGTPPKRTKKGDEIYYTV